MDDLIVRYLLNELSAEEQEQLRQCLPAAGQEGVRLEQWQQLLVLLRESNETGPRPAADLTLRTLARTAEYAVAHGLLDQLVPPSGPITPLRGRTAPPSLASGIRSRFHELSDPWFPTWWQRTDFAVAAVIAFLAIGISLVGLEKLRHNHQISACQDQLRQVYRGLVSYSEVHDGRFPQVGTPRVPVAGAFLSELERTGHLPSDSPPLCPALPAMHQPGSRSEIATETRRASFAYSLGYLTPAGELQGLRRDIGSYETADWLPIAADLPGRSGQPIHHHGQNVLYTGGTVRFMVTPYAGIHGDHIYHNEAGVVRAGLHPQDTVLGHGENRP